MARLSLAFLGSFQVMLDGKPVTGFAFSKLRALLAYLAVEAASATTTATSGSSAGHAHPREALAGLLWPACLNATALANLRNALAQLRRAIGDVADASHPAATTPYLLITRETVQFNPQSDYALDVAAFERHIASSRKPAADSSAIEHLRAAVALYRGRFLEGLSSSDSEPFEEWATLQREHLEQQMLAALERLAAYAEQAGDYAEAERQARRQLALDPAREEAHRQLMRALALGGQRSAALAQYEACRRLLAQELAVDPAPETTALYECVRTGALGSRPPVTVPAPPPEDEWPDPESALCVARERELSGLHDLLVKALAGEGRVAFVVGEPGSGKTVLLHEFARRAMQEYPDLIVASGSCNAYTGLGDPYLPFVEILQLLTGDVEARRAGGALTREHARRLRAIFPAALQALVEHGPELIDTLLPGASLLSRAAALPLGPARARLEGLVQRAASNSVHPILPQAGLFERITRVLRGLAQAQPLLLVLDDLQWADAGSISLLFHLGRRLALSRILVVGAYRTAEVAAGRQGEPHPLEPVVHEFERLWGDPPIDLSQSESRQFVEALLDSEPNRLGRAFRDTLYRHTEGQALFTVELLRGLQERGDLRRDESGCWVEAPDLDWEALPTRVEAVIAQHMRRLPPAQRALLAVASVEGEEFTAEVVARVRRADDAQEVIACLSEELGAQQHLVHALSTERISLPAGGDQRLSRYRFRHHLFQHYLYHSLDEVQRVALHEQVGNALETLHGATPPQAPLDRAWADVFIVTGEMPPLNAMGVPIAPQLARHFEAAGNTNKAVAYLQQAAGRAIHALAHQEAIAHLTHAITLLQALPSSGDAPSDRETARTEWCLQENLGELLRITRGFAAPELDRTCHRSYALAQQRGDAALICRSLLSLADFHRNRAEYHLSVPLEEQGLAWAQPHAPFGGYAPRFEMMLGHTLFRQGELVAARQRMEHSLALGEKLLRGESLQRHRHAGMNHLIYALWILGFPQQAAQMDEQGPGRSGNPNLAHPGVGELFKFRREWGQILEFSEERLGRRPEDVWWGSMQHMALINLGWAHAHTGRAEQGITEMRQGLAGWQAAGNGVCLSEFLAMLGEGYALAGRVAEGLNSVEEALTHVERTGEGYHEAEIRRIKGELLLQDEDEKTAEACFFESIGVARRQEARSWELRATVSLARLWQKQGKVAQAREALAAIYGWFTEGFDTPDLVEARALLAELG